MFVPDSASLSSTSFFPFFWFLLPPVVVGVAFPLSLNEADMGVGACDAGVEPGVAESYFFPKISNQHRSLGIPKHGTSGTAWERAQFLLTALFGRYEMDDREKTRFCSGGPVFRLCAAAPLVPFM